MLEHYEAVVKREEKPFFAGNKELLKENKEKAFSLLRSCRFCERKCGVNRLNGETGFCGCGVEPRVFGAHEHLGEEDFLVPSATLFFSGCTMRCGYCQNAPASVEYGSGEEWTPQQIAEWMLLMQERGCKNVNFVGGDPTPNLHNVLNALSLTKAALPVVWNSNAFYSSETAGLLEGLVDLYLLDFRYFGNECAESLSNAPGYVEAAKRNHLQAAKAGDLVVRLLVLPNHVDCCALPIVEWLAENLKEKVVLNVLAQYRPCFKASDFPDVSRRVSFEEVEIVKKRAMARGLALC